jgi:alkylhydroperoxidase family enzyme
MSPAIRAKGRSVTWLPRQADGDTPFERVFGLRPQLLAQFDELYSLLWSPPRLDARLLELCRLHVAGLHGCPAEPRITSGLQAETIAALPRWREEQSFSAGERACLAFAEKFALAVQSVGDEDTEELRLHLSPAEIVALCQALALFDGFTRFRLILEAT